MSETKVITIDPPITFDAGPLKERIFDQLELREPRAAERKKANGQLRSGINAASISLHDINLVAIVSAWPVPAVEKLRQSLVDEAADFLTGFAAAVPDPGSARGDTRTIALDDAVGPVDGKTYDTLALREPTSGEMRRANEAMRVGANPESVYSRNIKLVSLITGWPEEAVGMLPDSKLQEASNFLLGFR